MIRYDENGQPIQYVDCHKLTPNGFQFVTNQTYIALGSVAVGLENRLWISGYRDKYTEFISLQGEVTQGPDLPENLNGHCMVKIDDKTVMMVGGQVYPEQSGRTYFLDVPSGKWTQGPALLIPRAFHSCGLFEFKDQKFVLAIGGETADGYLKSVEYFDLQAMDEWRQDVPLPVALFDPVVVSLGTRIVVIGGFTDDNQSSEILYEFVCPTLETCEWIPLKKQLEESRLNFVAMPVPDEFVTCE